MNLRKVKFLPNWKDRIGEEEKIYQNGFFHRWVDGERYSCPFGLVEDELGKMLIPSEICPTFHLKLPTPVN